jgi:hypothetical protein
MNLEEKENGENIKNQEKPNHQKLQKVKYHGLYQDWTSQIMFCRQYDTESSLICSKVRAILASLSQVPDIDTGQMVNKI